MNFESKENKNLGERYILEMAIQKCDPYTGKVIEVKTERHLVAILGDAYKIDNGRGGSELAADLVYVPQRSGIARPDFEEVPLRILNEGGKLSKTISLRPFAENVTRAIQLAGV